MSLDNDVTMVLALNRISAIFGFFFNALRYVFFGRMSSALRSFRKMYKRNFKISWNLYKKCGKFSRASWEFDVVLSSEQKEIPEQRNIQIYDIASTFTHFCAHVRQL